MGWGIIGPRKKSGSPGKRERQLREEGEERKKSV
jgi:hypothetical protein